MEVQEPKLLSVQEFANRVNRTERAVYKAIKSGRIKALKTDDNSAYQIPEEELQTYGSASSAPVQNPVNSVPESLQEPTEPVLQRVQQLVQEGFLGALERANEEIRRVERQKIELELQLRLHRNLLTENAESLLEKQAETETFRHQANALAQRVAELEQKNAELLTEQQRSWWSKIWKTRRKAEPSTRAETA